MGLVLRTAGAAQSRLMPRTMAGSGKPRRSTERPAWPFGVNTSSQQYAGADYNLVGWWPMSHIGWGGPTVPCLVGERTGTVGGTGAADKWVGDDEMGNVLNFDGSTNVVDSTAGLAFFAKTDAMSVSFWIKTTDTTSRLVTKWARSDSAGWEMDMESGPARFGSHNAAGTAGYFARGGTTVSTGRWTHLAGTYNGSASSAGIRVFVNGVLETMVSVLNTDPGTLADSTIRFGASSGSGADRFFTGKMMDVRVYRGVLPPGIVADMYRPETRWELYKP